MINIKEEIALAAMDRVWIVDINNAVYSDVHRIVMKKVWAKVEEQLGINHSRHDIDGWMEALE